MTKTIIVLLMQAEQNLFHLGLYNHAQLLPGQKFGILKLVNWNLFGFWCLEFKISSKSAFKRTWPI
jgi:hypothetical protein